ncbi:MAG: MFS transporter [Bacteroidales bacterium]|nr:MFS transporter [Bacteroidales bacterium]
MKRSFLGIDLYNRKEAGMLTITSLQAFFIGAFFTLFYTGSHVLFIQSFTIEEFPKALIVSGIIGMILLFAYSYLSSRIPVRLFVITNLCLVLIINILLFAYYDRLTSTRLYGFFHLLPFAFVFPLTVLTILTFRRSFRTIFRPDQNKRFYPLIQTSFMAGIIVTSYALVGVMFFTWDVLYILAASIVFIALAALLQLFINMLHKYSESFSHVPRRPLVLRSKFYEFFYSRHTLLLALFVLISGVTGFIVHFYFIKETHVNIPNTISMARFFGFFMGTMFLFVLFLERYLIRKILYTYDSPYSIVLVPMILLVAFIASLIVDLLSGSSNTLSMFSFGFITVVILRIGYESTLQAIELPSLRVLFRTLDLRYTNAIIPRMEGSFRMVALLLAGLILSGLYLIGLKLNLFLNLILIVLVGIWVPVTIMLIKSYQKALRESIHKLRTSKRIIEQELLNTDEKTHELLNSDASSKVIHTLSLLEKLEPLKHEMHIMSMLGNSPTDIGKIILEKIEENSLLIALPKLKEMVRQNSGKQTNNQLSRLINRFENKFAVGLSEESLDRLVNSNNLTDRILAAEIIGASTNKDMAESLTILSRDIEPDVKFSAVKAMARMSLPDHSYILIDYLSTPGYYPYVFDALVRIGDPALSHLERMFLMPDADNRVLSRIVRIYGKIGTTGAIELLLGKLENQHRSVMHQALLALRESKFQSTPDNINRILNDIVRLINIMSWNFAAHTSLAGNKRFQLLKDALESEINENYNSLYHLLALAYNPTSIGNIKYMLTEGGDTDISFAIELLDQIVNEEIKQVFLPVVENLPHKERFRQLQYFFHAEKLNPEELITEILTRDFNSLSLYVKACAIFNVLELPGQTVSQELIACLFHPDKLMRESAAYVIGKLEPDSLDSIYPRMNSQLANEIRYSLSFSRDGFPYLLLHRIRFLKECPGMSKIPEEIMLEIAKELDICFLNAGDEFLIKHNDVHYAFMIIFEGEAQIKISTDKVITFGKNDIIYSDILVEEHTFSLKANTDLKLYNLDQELLNSLMFDHIEFRNSIIGLIEEA